MKIHERPAVAEREALLADVRDAPRLQLLHGPVAGFFELRRAHQARAVAIGQPEHRVHDLRAIQALVADLRERGGIDGLGGLGEGSDGESGGEDEGTGASCAE